MPVAAQPQTSLYETTIEDADLERALEKRDELRTRASEARALFVEADENAKSRIGELDLGDDAPVRVGRFVLKRTLTPARSVSFETEAKIRTRISTIDDD